MAKLNRAAKTTSAPKKDVVQASSFGTQPARAAKKTMHPDEFYGRVAFKAHELYVKRGGQHGNDFADWFEAERLVRAEFGL
jgi:hypothetical protein